MSWCTKLLMLLLLDLLLIQKGLLRDDSFQINPANIRPKIRQSLDIINVTWRNPNKKVTEACYRTEVQFKSQCDEDWQSVEISGFFFKQPLRDQRKNYMFRLRMKYECIYKNWSAWTPEIYSMNRNMSEVHCEEAITHTDFKAFFVLLLMPLLICCGAQKQIRRLLLPKIPDPKHITENLLKIDQTQWKSTVEVHCTECDVVEMETVCLEKEEEEVREEPPETGHSEPTTLTQNMLLVEGAWPTNYSTLASQHSAYVYC